MIQFTGRFCTISYYHYASHWKIVYNKLLSIAISFSMQLAQYSIALMMSPHHFISKQHNFANDCVPLLIFI